MRLIDGDYLKELFDPNTWQGDMLRTIIDKLPTAYDVEKVIEGLDNLVPYHTTAGDFVSKADVIRLVRGGGIA